MLPEKDGVTLLRQYRQSGGSTPVILVTALLRQILDILTDNALRYAPEGSTVHLDLKIQGKYCLLSVIDHGPGIPDREKKQVFDRFCRGSVSRPDTDHFGLGLSVARELAEVQGGKITLADTPGGGAAFTLWLPRT